MWDEAAIYLCVIIQILVSRLSFSALSHNICPLCVCVCVCVNIVSGGNKANITDGNTPISSARSMKLLVGIV